MNTRHIAAVTVLLAAAVVPVANAVIINVPGDQPTIQAGVNAANDGDEVVVAPGTYIEAVLNIGKEITLRSSGGPEVTTIDANNQVDKSVIRWNPGGTASIIQGFTLTGGTGHFDFIIDLLNYGGGIYIQGGHVTVIDCVITGNNVTILNDGWGGGIFVETGTATIVGCTLTNNVATSGGGLFAWSTGGVVLYNCEFVGNAATAAAGFLFDDGGAIRIDIGPLTLAQCVFSDNSANGDGGAVHNSSNATTIRNCAFAGNTAGGNGGGVLGAGNVANSIFWENADSGPMDASAQISGGATVTYSCVFGGWAGAGNIDVDPQFADAANHDLRLSPGSPCIDAGDNTSIALDLPDFDGDGITQEPVPIDADGNPRQTDDLFSADVGNNPAGFPIVDMGAYEFPVPATPGGNEDCNSNFVNDLIDILNGTSQDCNNNLVPDACDIAAGTSLDANGNGIPDECPADCPADIDNDDVVGINDFLDLLANWGPCP